TEGTSKNLLRGPISGLRCSPYLRTAVLLAQTLGRSLRFLEVPVSGFSAAFAWCRIRVPQCGGRWFRQAMIAGRNPQSVLPINHAIEKMNITINEELRSYIDPLTVNEYAALERSILAEGCRDALVLWGEVLIDGHNRYAI